MIIFRQFPQMKLQKCYLYAHTISYIYNWHLYVYSPLLYICHLFQYYFTRARCFILGSALGASVYSPHLFYFQLILRSKTTRISRRSKVNVTRGTGASATIHCELSVKCPIPIDGKIAFPREMRNDKERRSE